MTPPPPPLSDAKSLVAIGRLSFFVYHVQMSEPNCEECRQLWRAYQQATIKYVMCEAEVNSPYADPMDFRRAVLEAEAAERERAEARHDIAAHCAEAGHI
jgi:hypothetical protein